MEKRLRVLRTREMFCLFVFFFWGGEGYRVGGRGRKDFLAVKAIMIN